MSENNKENERFNQAPYELPSPEELFDREPEEKELVSAVRKEPIPRYRVVRRFSIAFILFLLLFTLGLTQLSRLGYHYYYMISGSMTSVIPEGSFLLERDVDAADLKIGDIITYVNRDGESVTHQVVEVVRDYWDSGQQAFRTKGVDNVQVDEGIVTADMIQGKVIFHVPYLGRVLSVFQQAE